MKSTAPPRPLPSSSTTTADLWRAIALEAERESPLWAESLRPEAERERDAIFSPLGDARFALGLETIYEGYLVHYGRPRLFAPRDGHARVLLGDYLYAHGLVHVASLGETPMVANLAELLSLCSQLRAEGSPGDGPAWAATVALLPADGGPLEKARGPLRLEGDADALRALAAEIAGREAVERALALHAERID